MNRPHHSDSCARLLTRCCGCARTSSNPRTVHDTRSARAHMATRTLWRVWRYALAGFIIASGRVVVAGGARCEWQRPEEDALLLNLKHVVRPCGRVGGRAQTRGLSFSLHFHGEWLQVGKGRMRCGPAPYMLKRSREREWKVTPYQHSSAYHPPSTRQLHARRDDTHPWAEGLRGVIASTWQPAAPLMRMASCGDPRR